MKTLTLLRHAKTERDAPSGRDFDRSLNERGRGDAKRIGREIRDLGLAFDLVLVSPARRAAETVEEAGELAPQFEDRIYDASMGQLLEIVRSVDKAVERLMLVGHNPGFALLAASLTDDAVRDVPTATFVEIELPIGDWRDVGKHGGRLVRLIRPKSLT